MSNGVLLPEEVADAGPTAQPSNKTNGRAKRSKQVSPSGGSNLINIEPYIEWVEPGACSTQTAPLLTHLPVFKHDAWSTTKPATPPLSAPPSNSMPAKKSTHRGCGAGKQGQVSRRRFFARANLHKQKEGAGAEYRVEREDDEFQDGCWAGNGDAH
ncbi:hypothetical protein BDN67DRAFT_1016896 [Paxillus ammoniavirescens]|nr:hypothetical protein BDN67DRAFT_1016896 [Paxillus ammoniavirescens]